MTENFSSLKSCLEWLEANHPIDKIELGLARVRQVAKRLGLLQPESPVITVAGTNGKGSVVATLESLAVSHQLKVASFTSPHLIKFNERIKLDGQPVSDEQIIEAFQYVTKAQLNDKAQKTQLTYFEFTTLVALYIFSQLSLDLIVLEVGLGGRLDSVNVIDADLAILTSIGLDHTDWLGDSLAAIAYEKAGIMRTDKPAVIADPAILALLSKAIDEQQPKTIVATKDYRFLENDNNWSFNFKGFSFNELSLGHLYLPNMAAALAAFCQLFPEKTQVSKVVQGLAESQLLGRFQYLSDSPVIILDVAHNPDSARLLNEKLLDLIAKKPSSQKTSGVAKVWALCGMLKDKDIAASLAKMTRVNHWLFVDLPAPRGASAEQLQRHVQNLMADTDSVINSRESFSQLASAYQYFCENRQPQDLLLVFGSFVTVGQMLEYWQETQG